MCSTRLGNCQVCNELTAKYTCPRCKLNSCSLNCSKSHKARDNCNGERDRVAFVPLNEYTEGTLLDDYALLEDTKRRVEGIGKAAFKDKILTTNYNQNQNHSSNNRNNNGNNSKFKYNNDDFKARNLKWAFADQGIELRCSPLGMERRRKNTTHIDSKTREIKFTIEVIIQNNNPHFLNHVYQSTKVSFLLSKRCNIQDISKFNVYVKSQDGKYVLINKDDELIEGLRGCTIIDFPILIVTEETLPEIWRQQIQMNENSSDTSSDTSSDSSSDSDTDSDSSISIDSSDSNIEELNDIIN